MACSEKEQLLHAYFDGELDLGSSLAIEEHLRTCAECSLDLRSQHTLRDALRSSKLYQRAPRAVESRIRAAVRERSNAAQSAAPLRHERHRWAEWLVAAALLALAIFFGRGLIRARQAANNADELVAQEIVQSHVRSLQLNHLMDVPSTDQHTVKPWFDGKIDFAPDVNDFSAQGFALAGGRLDVIDHHTAAALVYTRRKHILNVFIWPDESKSERAPQIETIDGYHLVHWSKGGLHYWLVSDLSAAELDQLASLMRG